MIRIKDYFELWKANRINVNPDIKIVHETPSTAVVDGDMAMGMLPSIKSMEIAIEKARKVGTGWVSTRNSNHFGIAGYYAMMALARDMIGISLTQGGVGIVAPGSRGRGVGLNVISVAVPAGEENPFVLDMATGVVAWGKLELAARNGTPIPSGWAVDTDGNPDLITSRMMRDGVNLLFPMEVAAGCDVNAWRDRYPALGMMGGIDKRAPAAGPAAIDRELARIRPALE